MKNNFSSRQTQFTRFTLWWVRHFQACFSSLRDIVAHPLASLMTIAIISFAVALPAGLYILIQNIQTFNPQWDSGASISLYLKSNLTPTDIQDLILQLKKNPTIQNVHYISPAAGLNEFAQATQIQGINKLFPENPLPPVVVIKPTTEGQAPLQLERLISVLKQNPQIDTVQIDLQWVKRFYYILQIGKRMVYALALLFALGIVIIIGNTIRLIAQSHQQEMMILQLIGANYAFVRRPLLYRGFWYGLFGGILAWILIAFFLHWISVPLQQLMTSYGINTTLFASKDSISLTIIVFSGILGLMGAFISAKQYRSLEE